MEHQIAIFDDMMMDLVGIQLILMNGLDILLLFYWEVQSQKLKYIKYNKLEHKNI